MIIAFSCDTIQANSGCKVVVGKAHGDFRDVGCSYHGQLGKSDPQAVLK